MINSTGNQLPPQLVNSVCSAQGHQPLAQSISEFTFDGKPVTLAAAKPLALESASPVTDVAILARNVKPDTECTLLPETHLDNLVSWSQLLPQINVELEPYKQLLFAIYLGLPIADIEKKISELERQGQQQFDYLSWYSQQQGTRLIQEKLTITHETLLTMLAGISRSDLAKLHCEKFGIAIDPFRFFNEKSAIAEDQNGELIEWPYSVQASDTDAALNHELDFFKLRQIFRKDPYLSIVPTATLAFAAGYPELMEEQDLQQESLHRGLSTILLFKKILDIKGGSMSTGELVKIMSNPELLAISSAHQLIKSLQGHSEAYDKSEQRTWDYGIARLGYDLEAIGINEESFSRALELPLHINQKILNRVGKNEPCFRNISMLLREAEHCLPKLTAGHIAYVSMAAAKSCNRDQELSDLFEKSSKVYPEFHHLMDIKPPAVQSLYWQEDDISTEIAGSKPLTMDFLRCLPLSHNWHAIGMTMGLSPDELDVIGRKTSPEGHVSVKDLSVAAYELSRILVQPERGLETGHLYQALQYLDDQATLAYFPEHLSVHSDNPLPEHIAESLENGKLMARVLRTFEPEVISRYLKSFKRYDQMKFF
ncbi:hypothetical protein [Endozoicomonas sp. YOMI1]|uniref:hypothetical protein n=1 Tax=Endozoicomonas sp. YOMI1 TaxID=2828739 RepID=UPI0021475840|nr:hypothetical protein [Endozoicomonas sp. YOMI1]